MDTRRISRTSIPPFFLDLLRNDNGEVVLKSTKNALRMVETNFSHTAN